MKLYLAARYSRHPEMQAVAHVLIALGHEITSQWIWGHHAAADATLLQPGLRSQSAGFAQEDLANLREAEAFVGFSEPYRTPSRGGRHVELGIALALGKRIYVVGGAEHVFHCLPEVRHCATLEDVLAALAALAAGGALPSQNGRMR